MKTIRANKKIFLAAAIFALSFSLFALDFGGAFSNFTRVKGKNFSNLKLDQVDNLTGWIRVPIKKDGTSYFVGQALYEFEYDAGVEKVYNRLDINLAKYVNQWKIAGEPLTLHAGRFIFSDVTGLIMSQNCDGAYATYDFSRVSVFAYAGYTGFLNAATVKMQNHKQDPFDYNTSSVYQLAEKYLVFATGATVPNLFSTQTLSAQFLATFKLGGKAFNRMYLTVDMSGPIYKTIYYDASTTLGLQSFDGGSMEVTNLTRADFKYFIPFKDLAVGLGAVFASGNKNGDNAFTGFSKIDAFFAMNEPQYTSLFKISAAASIKPLKNLLVRAGTGFVFSLAKESGAYQGFEWSLGADWQIVSDAGVGATFQQYIDAEDSDMSKVQISLNAFLTF
ncbi:MAG: hypothetical protein J6V90_01655 [Treponema sp.]|nr:hypothetical protein [Treponema sp.]